LLGGLGLVSAAVIPFLAGHSLHAYWESVGVFLLLIWLALLVAGAYCTGLFWAAWKIARDLEKS
jgi:hypothetical protein